MILQILLRKTKYEKGGSDFEDKIIKIDKKIPDASDLIKKSALTAVENKIPVLVVWLKKTDYDTKISDIEKKITDHDHDKYITTPEFNTMAASIFNARLAAQTDLIKKTEFDVKLKAVSDRVTKNKSKHLLVESELKKLEKFDAAYFRGKNYFDGKLFSMELFIEIIFDGTQNCLASQAVSKYPNNTVIRTWKSKGLSDQFLHSFGTVSSVLLSNAIKPMHLMFNDGGFLIHQKKDAIANGSIVNIYIVNRLSSKTISSSIVLKNGLFGATKITNRDTVDVEPQKYKYSGYDICI